MVSRSALFDGDFRHRQAQGGHDSLRKVRMGLLQGLITDFDMRNASKHDNRSQLTILRTLSSLFYGKL